MWTYIPSQLLMPALAPGCSPRQLSSDLSNSESKVELFVILSGTARQRPVSWHGWKRRPWITLLLPTVLNPLMAQRGADAWIASVRERHANLIQVPASEPETTIIEATAKTETDPSSTSSGSSEKCDPPWSSLKMFASGLQAGLFNDSETNYRTWVTSSKIHSSLLRKTLALRMRGRGSSLWPTAMVASSYQTLEDKTPNQTGGTTLKGACENWPTPRAGNGSDSGSAQRLEQGANPGLKDTARNWPKPACQQFPWLTPHGISGNHGPNGSECAQEVKNWPSARAEDSESAGNHPNSTDSLTGVMRNWPTANARDEKGIDQHSHEGADGNSLPNAAVNWATLKAQNQENPGSGNRQMLTSQLPLQDQTAKWASPTASENANRNVTMPPSHGETRGTTTAGEAAIFPCNWTTPQAADVNHSRGMTGGTHKVLAKDVRFFPSSLPDAETPKTPIIPTGGLGLLLQRWTPPECRALNARFQWWLQGWPVPMNSESAEMAFVRWQRLMRSTLSFLVSCGD